LKTDIIPFTDASEIVAAQRESYDGTGPKGIKGDDIPLGARILRLAYELDALLTGRPPLGGNEKRFYPAVPISEAKERIQHASGAAFDPEIVSAFLAKPDGLWAQLVDDLQSWPGFDETCYIMANVTESAPDPPVTLKAAKEKFSAFLASQNYPEKVCWIAVDDLLVDKNTHFWIRPRPNSEERAAQQYAHGLDRKIGIELRAICATDAETFATVFVPKDDLDSQNHLMGHGLKLTCPVKRYSTSNVRGLVKWLALRLRNRHGRWRDVFGD
jgi:hypothetical protein